MLSHFIQTERGRQRHLMTPLAPILDGYLSRRLDQGFAMSTVAGDLKSVTAFGEYLAEGGLTVSGVGESTVEAFVEHYRSSPRRCGPARATPKGSTSMTESMRGSLRSLLAYLRWVGAVPPIAGDSPPPHEQALSEYLGFLRDHRGFADATMDQHRRWASALLRTLGTRSVDLVALTCADVEMAVVEIGRSLGRRSRQIMTTTVEAFVRHLRITRHVPASCVPFLPRQKTYALSSLPSVIPWAEVQRALDGIDASTAMGKRDRALVTLVTTYGLRASEVVNLVFEDFDWRLGVIHVRQSKTRRMLDLPLVPGVRAALVDYLREGRPQTTERRVFVKCHAPNGPISRAVLYEVVRKTLKGADVDAKHFGPHALRHARASQLLRRGASLKVVGDLLGHRVPEATLMYCKVAVENLRAVALELPEVTP